MRRSVSKLRTDCKVKDAYKIGKTLGTGGVGTHGSMLAWHGPCTCGAWRALAAGL